MIILYASQILNLVAVVGKEGDFQDAVGSIRGCKLIFFSAATDCFLCFARVAILDVGFIT